MNNSTNPIRDYLESRLGKRVSDTYWYRIKKWTYNNGHYSKEGIDRYLTRFAVPQMYVENTAKWLDKAPDRIKFDNFLNTVEKIYNIKWIKKPGRTTLYSWFHSAKIENCRKHYSYSKTDLIPVVNNVIYSRLIKSIN